MAIRRLARWRAAVNIKASKGDGSQQDSNRTTRIEQMEKTELLRQLCEKIQETDSQMQKDKQLTKTSRELKKAYEYLKKFKTDEHLNKLFQKEFLSDGNTSTRFRQEPTMEKRHNNGGKGNASMGGWLQGCEICNIGLVNEINKMVDSGLSVRKASRLLAESAKEQIGAEIFTSEAIRSRYLLHTNQREPHPKVVHGEPIVIEKTNDSSSIPPIHKQLELPLEFEAKVFAPADENVSLQQGADSIIAEQKAIAETLRRQGSELEKANKVIRKAAHLLHMIVAGQIEGDGAEDDRLSMESIKRHGPGIIISFIKLGIDVFKVHEFYTGGQDGLSEVAIEPKDFQSSESNLAVQNAPQQRAPNASPSKAVKGLY